jgi:chromate transporter
MLGVRRAGLAGGAVASLGFTLPSAILMIVFAYGVASLGDLRDAGWLHGLKLAAVAVVAKAVIGMGRQLCPDAARRIVAALAAACLIVFPNSIVQISVILAGGIAGLLIDGKQEPPRDTKRQENTTRRPLAVAALVTFAALLVLLPVLVSLTGNTALAMFDGFFRAGSLVFGGGHVVLPLLRAEVVPHGWVSDDAFLAGYGAAQALPGPLFTFAAYLGAVASARPWLGGLWCLFAVFLPGWLLILGALPFWQRLRAKSWAQAALRGANASVVGVLLAALYNPVATEGIHDPADFAVTAVLFALLQWGKCPPWLVVLVAAAAGQWLPF